MNDSELDALKDRVFDRASSDPEFRSKLLSAPREAVVEMAEQPIPEFIKFEAVEEKRNTVILMVPLLETEELSDDDLEAVSGGSKVGNAANNQIEKDKKKAKKTGVSWDEMKNPNMGTVGKFLSAAKGGGRRR